MNFTQDWFSYNLPHLSQLIQLLPARQSILEVGCFEGKATCWFLENVLDADGTMVCVDPFTGSMEHSEMDLSGLYKTFTDNVNEVKKPSQNLRVFDTYSYQALAKLIIEEAQFDLIYIDGSHMADDVFVDAAMAWGLLKPKGIFLFDDYAWSPEGFNDYQKPKIAIDAFVKVFGDQLDIKHIGHQLAVQKI